MQTARREFNSAALAELRFHCAAEFCVCLAIFWLTWPVPGTILFVRAASCAPDVRSFDEDRWGPPFFDLSSATRAGFPR
jgi:hypothetical protein